MSAGRTLTVPEMREALAQEEAAIDHRDQFNDCGRVREAYMHRVQSIAHLRRYLARHDEKQAQATAREAA